MRLLKTIGAAVLMLFTAGVTAQPGVDDLLKRNDAPPGVLFEIVSGDPDALERKMPQVQVHAQRLRERFPGLEIAVVTHGAEQFSLLSAQREGRQSLHSLVDVLGKDQNIQTHVCGNHASWYDKVDEDFPEYVDVAPSASAQINDYRKLGFVVIIL